MTGPESLAAAGYAAILSKVLGKTVAFVDVPSEAARAGMLNSGMPAAYVDALLNLLEAMKRGDTAGTTNDVERVLGRKPGTFEAWVWRNASAFR